MRIQRLLKLHRLLDQAGEGGTDTGGTGTGASGEGNANDGTAAKGGAADDGQAKGGEGGTGAADDGKSKSGLSDADAKLLKDVMQQKARAAALEAELEAAKKRLADFDGVDATKARELLAANEEAERKAAESRGEYDRLVAQMRERHQSESAAVQEQLLEARNQVTTLSQQIAEMTVGSAFAGSTFVQDDLTLTATKARVIYGAHFEFKDGKVVGFDKPAGASERTVLVDSAGEPLNFNEALRALVNKDPDRDRLLRAKSKAGAGSTTQTKGAKKVMDELEQQRASKLSGAAKISAGLKLLAKAGSAS